MKQEKQFTYEETTKGQKKVNYQIYFQKVEKN